MTFHSMRRFGVRGVTVCESWIRVTHLKARTVRTVWRAVRTSQRVRSHVLLQLLIILTLISYLYVTSMIITAIAIKMMAMVIVMIVM